MIWAGFALYFLPPVVRLRFLPVSTIQRLMDRNDLTFAEYKEMQAAHLHAAEGNAEYSAAFDGLHAPEGGNDDQDQDPYDHGGGQYL